MGNIVVKVVIQGILLTEVLPILLEAEREDMDLPMAPREQRGEVGAEEEGVGTGEVDVPPASRMDAVDGLLEIRAELYLVDEQAIVKPLFARFDDLLSFHFQNLEHFKVSKVK
nr:hypothetical protein [Curtanaerobium respiraculi]